MLPRRVSVSRPTGNILSGPFPLDLERAAETEPAPPRAGPERGPPSSPVSLTLVNCFDFYQSS